MKTIKRMWKDISQGNNITLYVTAVAAIGLTFIKIFFSISTDLISSITLTVLCLLAISILGSRYHLEDQLNKFSSLYPSILKSRDKLPYFQYRGQSSSEIVIVGVSLVSAVIPNLNFFEQKMKEKCKLRFILLDPNEENSINVFNLISKTPNIQEDIEQTLKMLKKLIDLENSYEGTCEVRLSKVFLPFGLAAFDPERETGIMNLEINAYRCYSGERPHFDLTKANNYKWFEFYRSQYEQVWKDSKPWIPTN